MLLPALKNARNMAKRSACQNNLKQWSLNFAMYSSDFNGWLPDPAVNAWSTQGWATQIDKVMTRTEVPDLAGITGYGNVRKISCRPGQQELYQVKFSKAISPTAGIIRSFIWVTKVSMHKRPTGLHALYDGMYCQNEPWNNDGSGTACGMSGTATARA
jgi:hypothetical protein